MRKTIKQLTAELASITEERNNLWRKINEEGRKERMDMMGEMSNLRQVNNMYQIEIDKLMEIVRWLINPKTAESPFIPTKEQREDKKIYQPVPSNKRSRTP
jgi:hypothetical protein